MVRQRNDGIFFGILKSEIFYGIEENYKNLDELEKAINNYFDYYNKRIKVKLKGLSPVQSRTKSGKVIIN